VKDLIAKIVIIVIPVMADVLDIDNAEEFEVDDEGDRKSHFL
jgi:hypothetical protein